MATTQTAPKKKGLINFDFLQKLGKVLMTVIAVMPAAGLMISLGKLVQMGGGDIAAVMTIGTTMENIGWAVINNLHLGYMSETVRQLVRDSGFPGMKVLEFAFDSRDTGSASDYLPHNYPVNSVAYTGTHDNETLASWYQTITSAERARVRDYLCDYATPEAQLYKSMIALIFRSAAATCIIPMQDWLGLDNSARINKPSTVGENWRWRLKKSQLTPKLQKEICSITTRYGRMNWA